MPAVFNLDSDGHSLTENLREALGTSGSADVESTVTGDQRGSSGKQNRDEISSDSSTIPKKSVRKNEKKPNEKKKNGVKMVSTKKKATKNQKKEKPSKKIILIATIIPISVIVILAIVLPCVFLISKEAVLPEPTIGANHVRNGIEVPYAEGDDVKNIPVFTITEEGDFNSDKCVVESRFGKKDENPSGWKAGIRPMEKDPSPGTYVFGFRYKCGKELSKVTEVVVKIDPSILDLHTTGVLYTSTEIAVNISGDISTLTSVVLAQDKEEFDVLNPGNKPVWLHKGTSGTSALFVILKEGQYLFKTTNKNNSKNELWLSVVKAKPTETEGVISFSKEVTALTGDLFDGLTGTGFEIGPNIEYVQPGAFGNTQVSSFSADGNPQFFTLVDGLLTTSDLTEIVAAPPKMSGPVTVGEKVTHIGELAFLNCKDLTTITLRDSIESIGDGAFEGCSDSMRLDILNATRSTSFKLNSTTDPFIITDYITSADFVGTSPSATLYITSELSSCPLATALGPLKVCESGNNGYELKEAEVYTVMEEADKQFTVGSCYVSGSKNVPLFGSDLVFSAKIDAVGPTIETTNILKVSEAFDFSAKEGKSGLASVSVKQNGLELVATEEGEIRNDMFKLECKLSDGSCTLTTDSLLPVTISAKDTQGNASEDLIITPVEWLCTEYLTNETLTIPNKVKILTSAPLTGCKSVTSVILPDNLESVDEDAFDGMTELATLSIGITNTKFKTTGGVLYKLVDTIPSTLIRFPIKHNNTAFTIDGSTKVIANHAFYGCTTLTTITLHKDITTIGEGALTGCSKTLRLLTPDLALTTVFKLNDSISPFDITKYITSVDFDETSQMVTLHITATLAASTLTTVLGQLKACRSGIDGYKPNETETYTTTEGPVKTLTRGFCYVYGTTYIPLFATDSTFNIMVDGAKPIITPPTSSMVLREMTFSITEGGSGIESVSVKQGDDTFTVNKGETGEKGNDVFKFKCNTGTGACTLTTTSTESITLSAKDTAGNIAHDIVFKPTEWSCVGTDVGGVILEVPTAIMSLTLASFTPCPSVTSIKLPDNLSEVSEDAFDSLTQLSTLTIADSNTNFKTVGGVLYKIVSSAPSTLARFPINHSGDEFTITGSTTTIGGRAFFGCSALKTLKLHGNLTSISADAFKNSAIASLTIEGVTASYSVDGEVVASPHSITHYEIEFTDGDVTHAVSTTFPSTNFDETTKAKLKFAVDKNPVDGVTSVVAVKRDSGESVRTVGFVYADGDTRIPYLNQLTLNINADLQSIIADASPLPDVWVDIVHTIGDSSFTLIQLSFPIEYDLKSNTVAAFYDSGTNKIKFLITGKLRLVVKVSDTESATQNINVDGELFVVPPTITTLTREDLNSGADGLLIPSTVSKINKDALYDMKSLRVIIVDTASPSRPEDVDFDQGYGGGALFPDYYHIHVLRVDLNSPPKFFVPEFEFFAVGKEIPILHSADAFGESLMVGETEMKSERKGLNFYLIKPEAGELKITFGSETKTLNVIDWNETRAEYGLNGPAFAGGVLNIPHGVYQIGTMQYKDITEIGSLILPPTVKVINGEAFQGCINLKSITIHSGLKQIKGSAFGLTKPTSLNLPGSIVILETLSLSNMGGTTGFPITLGEGLEKLVLETFEGSNISTVTIPSTVKTIEGNPFGNVPSQYELKTNNENFTMIGGHTLYDSKTKTLVAFLAHAPDAPTDYIIPNEITRLGDSAFNQNLPASLNKGVSTVTLNQNITYIGGRCFRNCSKLTKVSFPNKELTFGGLVFENAAITKITLPFTVWSIPHIGRTTMADSNITDIYFERPANYEDATCGGRNGNFNYGGCVADLHCVLAPTT